MVKTLFAPQTIGIIGGGQLGKMLAQSAQKYGYRVHVYDEKESACAIGVSHNHTIGSFNDREKLLDFASQVDVLTYEFENINGEILKELDEKAHLPQGHDFLLTTQDRILEKQWLNDKGIDTVAVEKVTSWDELKEALSHLGYPAVLKTTRFGYDGKGQLVIKDESQLESDRDDLVGLLEGTCILEAFCDFDFEASVVVARDQFGNIDCFESAHNLHFAGILSANVTTDAISKDLQAKLNQVAEKIAEEAKLVGVCGVEFFVTKDGAVLVNELAPRPHNTGHYTIEACNVSQFDQHILAIVGREILTSKVLIPTMMVNILGQHVSLIEDLVREFPKALVHLYDKGEAKDQRKMGHFILLGETNEDLENLIETNEFLNNWFKLIEEAG